MKPFSRTTKSNKSESKRVWEVTQMQCHEVNRVTMCREMMRKVKVKEKDPKNRTQSWKERKMWRKKG